MEPCPLAGRGVNRWINQRVLALMRCDRSETEIIRIVLADTRHCGRPTFQDITHSIETGRKYLSGMQLIGTKVSCS